MKFIRVAACLCVTALVLAGCQANAATPSRSAAAVGIPDTGSTAVKRSAPTGPLTGAQLAAALLPASAFGAGLVSLTGASYNRAPQTPASAAPLAAMDCADLTIAFSSGTRAQSYASEQFNAQDLSADGPTITQSAFQYIPGQAESDLGVLKTRLAGSCARVASGVLSGTITLNSVVGVGTEALLEKESTSIGGGTAVYKDTVFARYGDALIVVSIGSAAQSTVDGYELTHKVEQIAANLRLK